MNGPYAPDTFKNLISPSQSEWEKNRLVRGQHYRVVQSFVDADGDKHPVGEDWVFITSMFSRFDDELTLCVRLVSGDEWKIPLVWKPEAQQEVIEDFLQYVASVTTAGRTDEAR
jgi:hypothetical protein